MPRYISRRVARGERKRKVGRWPKLNILLLPPRRFVRLLSARLLLSSLAPYDMQAPCCCVKNSISQYGPRRSSTAPEQRPRSLVEGTGRNRTDLVQPGLEAILLDLVNNVPRSSMSERIVKSPSVGSRRKRDGGTSAGGGFRGRDQVERSGLGRQEREGRRLVWILEDIG